MKHYFPDVLPPDACELLDGYESVSRRKFSQLTGRSLRLVLRDEELAIDYLPVYCSSIFAKDSLGNVVMTGRGNLKKKPLNPFHQWLLNEIADLFSHSRSESTVIYQLTHNAERYSPLAFLEELRDAQDKENHRQQTRRECCLYRPKRPWQQRKRHAHHVA